MKYIAKITVCRFDIGDEAVGLTEERSKELLAIGAIVADGKAEPKAETKAKTNKKAELIELLK